MTIASAITTTYLRATGKTTTPSATKINKIVGLLNYYQSAWANENGIDWSSLYDPMLSIGTVTATDSFDIDTTSIRKLSDREGDVVRIVWANKKGYTDYSIVPADSLKDYYGGVDKESPSGHFCARMGDQLVFNHEFISTDNEYGGEIFIPCYTHTDEITSTSTSDNEVQVDDPNWLVTMSAAEYVRTDITRQGQFPNLLNEANALMARMKDDNDNTQITRVNTPWSPGTGTESVWS